MTAAALYARASPTKLFDNRPESAPPQQLEQTRADAPRALAREERRQHSHSGAIWCRHCTFLDACVARVASTLARSVLITIYSLVLLEHGRKFFYWSIVIISGQTRSRRTQIQSALAQMDELSNHVRELLDLESDAEAEDRVVSELDSTSDMMNCLGLSGNAH